jgi:hypothetical protein
MKNITTIILFTLLAFASLNTKAQGDLQFNQVRFESITFPTNSGGTKVDTLFVPQGKVLKITSITGLESSRVYGEIGEHAINDYAVSNSGVIPVKYPIWLPAGAHIVKSRYSYIYAAGNPVVVTISISGIEFNVVQ